LKIRITAESAKRGATGMKDFEEFGRWLDEEMDRVKRVIETEIKPTAEQKFSSALRIASKKLSEMAEEIDKRKTRTKA
jgi:hypothetical protein